MMTVTIAKVPSFNVTTPVKTLHHPSVGWFCRKNCRFHFQSPHYTGCCFQAACIFLACGPSDYFGNAVTVLAVWYWDAISVAHRLSFCCGLSSSQPEVWAGWQRDPMPLWLLAVLLMCCFSWLGDSWVWVSHCAELPSPQPRIRSERTAFPAEWWRSHCYQPGYQDCLLPRLLACLSHSMKMFRIGAFGHFPVLNLNPGIINSQ